MKAAVIAACCCAALALVGGRAAAASWSLEDRLQLRAESNDNVDLVQDSPGDWTQVSLRGDLSVERSSDSGKARLDSALVLPAGGDSRSRRVEGRMSLAFSERAGPLDSVNASGYAQRDSNLADRRVDATDVRLGRSGRVLAGMAAGWGRQWTERLSSQIDLNGARAGYTGINPGASDYRNATLTGTVNWAANETLRLGLTAAASKYTRLDGAQSSDSTSQRAGLTWSARERLSLSLGLGAYQSRQRDRIVSRVCPLPLAFCQAGLVAYVDAVAEAPAHGRGSQYDISGQWSADDRTSLTIQAARQLMPSGSGVVKADNLGLAASRALNADWRAGLAASLSRNRSPVGLDEIRPRLVTVEGSLVWSWREDLSLIGGVTARRYREPTSSTRASSTAFSISLQYQGPRIVATR